MSIDLETETPHVSHASLSEADTGDGQVLRAKLVGEISLKNSPAVRAELLRLVNEHKPARVTMDLADVPYMDSSAIAVLVEVLKAARKHGGVVQLINLTPRVRGLLEISRLESIFDMSDAE
ncbi:MAG: STAS domain-containing protein [Planctomycetota bacterium]